MLARTDAIALGVNAPLRESGKLADTPGITLRGPAGTVQIPRGVIMAHRHVHMPPDDARRFGVRDGQQIRVRVEGDREAVFGDVVVRVRSDFALDMHVDTDEANAAALTNDSVVAFDGPQQARRRARGAAGPGGAGERPGSAAPTPCAHRLRRRSRSRLPERQAAAASAGRHTDWHVARTVARARAHDDARRGTAPWKHSHVMICRS